MNGQRHDGDLGVAPTQAEKDNSEVAEQDSVDTKTLLALSIYRKTIPEVWDLAMAWCFCTRHCTQSMCGADWVLVAPWDERN
ncbi:hypothetical protein VNI00_017737 [Paramarasmius palmivorus]|uniref:Uncharacterized protein n=1 Tax=Paramarasmius palmivorus TaxID=297713 RepID=A0AAW0B2C4_9AGAR